MDKVHMYYFVMLKYFENALKVNAHRFCALKKEKKIQLQNSKCKNTLININVVQLYSFFSVKLRRFES